MDELANEKLVVKSDTLYLIQVRHFIQKTIHDSKLSTSDENKVILAVDEAVSNIIEHGYGNHTNGTIEIEVAVTSTQFLVAIRDHGKSFNPENLPTLDIQEHIKQGNKKGLGIFLMRRVMDEVRYHFKDGSANELILIKHIK